MNVAIFPGSFDPMHRGHVHTVQDAGLVFDRIIVAVGRNPDKESVSEWESKSLQIRHVLDDAGIPRPLVPILFYSNLFKDFVVELIVKDQNKGEHNSYAVIRGLRNTIDLEQEKVFLRVNKELGLSIPTFWVPSRAEDEHISSTLVRGLKKFGKDVKC